MKRVITLCLLWSIANFAAAADSNHGYRVYGIGKQACESYLLARDKAGYADVAYKSWLSGYLTAAGRSFVVKQDFAELLGELQAYCTAHPQQLLSQAMESLLAASLPPPDKPR